MVRITKGSSVLTVTRGAYENYFRQMGYEIEGGSTGIENLRGYNYPLENDSFISDNSGTKTSEPEEDYEDLSEIPIGEMTFEQLHKRAGQLGVDHKDIHSKKELRAAIREQLRK